MPLPQIARSQCPRCLRHSFDPEDGQVHTCTPTPLVRGLETRISKLEAQLAAQDADWDASHKKAVAMVDSLRNVLEGFAEGDCSYGDNCPDSARHYRCYSCKARKALNPK